MVMMNSAASCKGMDFLPYTTIMLARKLTSTSTVSSSQCTGPHRLINKVTALHSSTEASISLNLWRSGLGMSIRVVHRAPMHTVMAVSLSLISRVSKVRPTRPMATRKPR